MNFRPCIDIHNGAVKQIVGSSLKDTGDEARENFVSLQGANDYASIFRRDGLPGGHVILLNHRDSPYFEATKRQALLALDAYPGGLQVGGGINPDNAEEFLDAGASHVIVTSYVFSDGKINFDHLDRLVRAVGRDRLVLDLSCSFRDGVYYIMTDRWQKYTDTPLDTALLRTLESSCSEFLVHAIDVEGKGQGIDVKLVRFLASEHTIPVTYAGGVHSYADIDLLNKAGEGRVDFTIGSALDLYGGSLSYEKVKEACKKFRQNV
ncbi:MAG: phosphoribosylformimino-5-aminoimidazole carboxamide ribotide isomerase [Lachnospiraceae bacterium]|nr:phosphoribosylformimino-5-aminoimidazole carboxamide ribotide isomerase [Lachnospiraceae bacterium]